MTKKTRKVKKDTVTIKAWAVLSQELGLPMWGNHQLLVYRDRKSAREASFDAYCEKEKVVPCEISYTINTSNRK